MARPIVIANENGDWWEHIPNAFPAPKLYVLNLNTMKPEEIAELGEELDLEENEIDEEIMNQDKLHKVIWDYGHEIPIQIDNSLIDGLIDQINHLRAVIRELSFAKKGE
jgi:hypothetical protein